MGKWASVPSPPRKPIFFPPNHQEPIRGNGNASRAHQVPFTTPLPVDHLLGKLFKYLTRCGRGASAVRILPHGVDQPALLNVVGQIAGGMGKSVFACECVFLHLSSFKLYFTVVCLVDESFLGCDGFICDTLRTIHECSVVPNKYHSLRHLQSAVQYSADTWWDFGLEQKKTKG